MGDKYDIVFCSQAELDGSFEGFKREFDKTVVGAFYDTKLIAQR